MRCEGDHSGSLKFNIEQSTRHHGGHLLHHPDFVVDGRLESQKVVSVDKDGFALKVQDRDFLSCVREIDFPGPFGFGKPSAFTRDGFLEQVADSLLEDAFTGKFYIASIGDHRSHLGPHRAIQIQLQHSLRFQLECALTAILLLCLIDKFFNAIAVHWIFFLSSWLIPDLARPVAGSGFSSTSLSAMLETNTILENYNTIGVEFQMKTIFLLLAYAASMTGSDIPVTTAQNSRQLNDLPAGPYLERGEAQAKIADVRWELVDALSDEFVGDSIDSAKWQTEPFENGWVWIGRPPGLFRAENVKVNAGMMKVTVSKLEKPVKKRGDSFLYQGAIVRSINPGKPGWYYETRMKANATEMSSTFWLMTSGKARKRLELDIQECVGVVSPKAEKWAHNFDNIFHSNMIQRRTRRNKKVQIQGSVETPTKNHERFYIYGCWWKSPEEVHFFLDGKYVYSITPNVPFDEPSHLQMAIETYDWNPVPEGGGMVADGNREQRTTSYDWIRVWKVKAK